MGRPGCKELVALDCEMVITAGGRFELARCTVIDQNREKLYDEFCVPRAQITDYNTRYSGITPQMLQGILKRIEDVQTDLQQFINKDTIIVGHSLENDLNALQIIHRSVIDTSLLFPHPRPPRKSSLKFLAQKFLGRDIQNKESDGHDSKEDAIAALDLVLAKVKNGPDYGEVRRVSENVFTILSRYHRRSYVAGQPTMLKHISSTPASCVPAYSDEECVRKTCNEIRSGSNKMVWATLENLRKDQPTKEEISKTLEHLKKLYIETPNNSVFLVYGSPGEVTRVQDLLKLKKTLSETKDWTTESESELRYLQRTLYSHLCWLGVRHG